MYKRQLYNLVGFQTNLKWGEQKRVFSMIPGLEPVSYTHLDVYKRQDGAQMGIMSPRDALKMAIDKDLDPVSYTHLDVYKRQCLDLAP